MEISYKIAANQSSFFGDPGPSSPAFCCELELAPTCGALDELAFRFCTTAGEGSAEDDVGVSCGV